VTYGAGTGSDAADSATPQEDGEPGRARRVKRNGFIAL